MKKTKIVCTIGPASESVEKLVELMNNGMNVARLNFSHGDYAEHGARIESIHAAEKISGKSVPILLDTKGPEIRTHNMGGTGIVEFETGDVVRVSMTEVSGTREKFSVSYDGLINDVEIGGLILLDDGLVALEVTELDHANGDIVTKVLNPGILKSKKGVNVPNASIKLPGITEKDAEDIRFGVRNGATFIAASFVRTASDVLEIRKILDEEKADHVAIIPKIENQEGVDNIDEILAVSQGLMVARGDLGVEVPAEEVPVIQKALIKKCNLLGKPVITATQMLDSMQHNPRPTRAEASDVANAIFDGTDAIMLSGETAAGAYPAEAVATMARIAERSEHALEDQDKAFLKINVQSSTTEAIGNSVAHTARNLGVKAIVAATRGGHTARMISKFRPKAPILALTFDPKTYNNLAISWGVYPKLVEAPSNTDELFELADKEAVASGLVEKDDLVIVTAGIVGSNGEAGTTNLLKISKI
ncbi:pyruvate kinase [Brochothrix campestris FSL F6-1037]|uniref:Pyruvate kinase n=1 Tax=Brochothrix campestris FSL F6-1037 TaxID=1265861 RepID=W7CUK7_9LIST|nr:pyruvate kinase [Brochothrix campestris FSL F6-1037]